MKYKTLQNVPTAKLRKWLAEAERAFGTKSPTAQVYKSELQRRLQPAKVERGLTNEC